MADNKTQNKPVYPKKEPETRKQYKIDEVYVKSGRKRKVVGIIGIADTTEIPVLIIQDITGREYDVAPQLTMNVIHNLERITDEAEQRRESGVGNADNTWVDVDQILNVVSEACISDAPKFTPEFLKSNFDVSVVIMFSQEIIKAAMMQAKALKGTYDEDPAVKNGKSATAK